MAIENTFLRLTDASTTLREALQEVGLTAREYGPSPDELFLVQKLSDLLDDLRGWSEEGSAAAAGARQAIAHPPDLHKTRCSLDEAGERLMMVRNYFFDELLCYEIVDALTRFGREGSGEWLGWTSSVLQGLVVCREALRALDRALLQVWQEFAERLASRSLSLQTTHIGQQIIPAPMSRAGVSAGAQRSGEEHR